MGFGTAVKTCFQKYFDFNGRASVAEFWWFVLFQFLVSVAIAIVVVIVAALMGAFAQDASGAIAAGIIILFVFAGIVAIAAGLPLYAAQARRLHDMGQSGWWVLLNFVSLGLVPLIMAAFPPQPYPNAWGPEPVA